MPTLSSKCGKYLMMLFHNMNKTVMENISPCQKM